MFRKLERARDGGTSHKKQQGAFQFLRPLLEPAPGPRLAGDGRRT